MVVRAGAVGDTATGLYSRHPTAFLCHSKESSFSLKFHFSQSMVSAMVSMDLSFTVSLSLLPLLLLLVEVHCATVSSSEMIFNSICEPLAIPGMDKIVGVSS